MDLDAVRTFVAVVDAGRFQGAAVALSVTQQAVSKRIAALERDLGVPLFTRGGRGARLTVDGQALLPHARELLRVEARAEASVRPERRALRVDVVGRRIAPAVRLQEFHRAHPEIELDVVTMTVNVHAAIAAVAAGTVDATFHAVPFPAGQLPGCDPRRPRDRRPPPAARRPRHLLADARAVTPAQLVGHRIWMPGMDPDSEWAAYYEQLADAFGLTIDVLGPAFGNEALMDELADSPELATFAGEGTRYLWPDRYDLRRIPVRDPTPVYPMSLIWRADNPHPALGTLRDHLVATRPDDGGADTWAPSWARPFHRPATLIDNAVHRSSDREPAMPTTQRQPNLFELKETSGGTQITYSASSFSGEPELSYQGPHGPNAFSGDGIERVETALGTELSGPAVSGAGPRVGHADAGAAAPPRRAGLLDLRRRHDLADVDHRPAARQPADVGAAAAAGGRGARGRVLRTREPRSTSGALGPTAMSPVVTS